MCKTCVNKAAKSATCVELFPGVYAARLDKDCPYLAAARRGAYALWYVTVEGDLSLAAYLLGWDYWSSEIGKRPTDEHLIEVVSRRLYNTLTHDGSSTFRDYCFQVMDLPAHTHLQELATLIVRKLREKIVTDIFANRIKEPLVLRVCAE